jgi:hypothetical protein
MKVCYVGHALAPHRTAISDFSDDLNADCPLHRNLGLVRGLSKARGLTMFLALSAAANLVRKVRLRILRKDEFDRLKV